MHLSFVLLQCKNNMKPSCETRKNHMFCEMPGLDFSMNIKFPLLPLEPVAFVIVREFLLSLIWASYHKSCKQ